MGFIDFVKRAGKRLGIGKSDDAPSADALKKEVKKHGLEAENLDIKVDGDEVELRGEAMSKELREKIIVAVGNIAGVARVNNRIDTKDDTKDADYHTVVKGETLWGISTKHYGNGAHFKDIFEANRPMLTHPDKIYPGQVLRIPPRD